MNKTDCATNHQQDYTGDNLNDDNMETIELYQELVPTYLQEFADAYESKNYDQVKFLAHKMSSAMGIMGFDNIVSLLSKIEKNNYEYNELGSMIQNVSEQIEHTLLFFKNELHRS